MEKRASIAVESDHNVAGVVAKSGTMYLGIITLWLLSLAWFIPRLAALGGDLTALNTGLLVFVLFCLTLFWFYGFHFLGFFLFTLMARGGRASVSSEEVKPSLPRVAVLYPTADDFELEAVQSCIDQRYPDFHVFLLDDSSTAEYQARVDAFHREHPEQTTVIRRGDRQGYKAGNINNALSKIGTDYELFAVCDSDNILPADFLIRMVPHFSDDPMLGFAQASHRRNRVDTDPFVQDMEHLANVRWEYHNLPRNPVRLAQEVAMLDHLSRGRAEFGTGIGVHEHEFIRWGMSFYDRQEMSEEALDIIEMAWRDGRVTHEGKFWHFDEAIIQPMPYRQPHPPIWAAVHSPRASAE